MLELSRPMREALRGWAPGAVMSREELSVRGVSAVTLRALVRRGVLVRLETHRAWHGLCWRRRYGS